VILADTSVWIDHFRSENIQMKEHLRSKRIVMHPYIVGELALGSVADRADVLQALDELPQLIVAEPSELRELIERGRLYSRGIGWVDTQLLACLLIDRTIQFWTTDKRLSRVASEIGIPMHPGSLPN
jgi:predicted nucleic acid-binding protein